MQYVNPYEILGFDRSISLSELSSELTKRAKKQLFAEVELNNNVFNYGLIQLTKTDCAKAIEDLDNDVKRRLHFFIFQHKSLNDFLVDGNLALFNKHQLESIYTASEFIDFVNPYFAFRFDKALFKAFISNNNGLLKSILKYEYLIAPSYINDAYRSLNTELTNRIKKTNSIKEEIKNGNVVLMPKGYTE